jgi:hypothetical protein
MPKPPHTFINGHESVLARFGNWPSFHDGEVHRLVLDSTRRDPDGSRYPSIELELRGWIMTTEVTEKGFYRCESDSIVCFLFEKVYAVELDGLNHQNVLSCFDIELQTTDSGETHLSVTLEHCFGLSGSFIAAQASVVSVTPYSASSAT